MTDKKQSHYVYSHPYVYVVLEHAFGTYDCKIHGVYTTKSSAEGKKQKVKKKGANGYVAILKKPIEGKKPSIMISRGHKHSHIMVSHDARD